MKEKLLKILFVILCISSITTLQAQSYDYLALVGDGTSAGWNPYGGIDTRMEQTSPGIWKWEGALKGSGVFKIHTVDGDWCDGQWLVPVNDGDLLPTTSYSFDVTSGCEPNDYKWDIPADGFYSITVDTNTGTIVSEELPYHPNLYIIGSATVSDWSADLAREMTQDPQNPHIFTWEGNLDQNYEDGLFNDAEFKILNVRTFESGWDEIRATSANADPLSSNSFVIEEGGTGNDDQWQITGGNRGSYRITLNLDTKAINFERLDYYPNLYVVGDATAKGWNPWSEDLKFIQDESNSELFSFRGNFVPGSFKIHTYVGDWNWGDYIVPTAADQDISATDYEINRQGQGNDYKWIISEEGIYTISLDQAANTINIILDTDGDGTKDSEDAFPEDPNEDTDTDSDGIGNNADTDDDGDGQSDEDEIACGSDPLDAASTATDTDSDNTPDCVDTDDDGDGVIDAEDAFPLDKNETTDTDKDGTGNNADTDDDGDGQSDEHEISCGSNPLDASSVSTDTDNDGIPNCVDTDDDGDGVTDEEDAFPLDKNETTDTDGDGTGNNADTDDDNDGQIDEHETSCGSDPLDASSVSTDTDSDGIPDCVDSNDDTDTDYDGIPDVTDADDDNDGQKDEHELACGSDPLDASSTATDTDSDNIPNCVDTDDDGDGVIDEEDAFPLDPGEVTDTDNDGTGNNADTDDDGDGQTDEDEITCGSDPLDASSTATDTDSDNIPDCVDPDDDGDGVNDEEDTFPLDASEDTDTDNDGIGNNTDTDDDGDGQSDEDELACESDPLDSSSVSIDTDNDGIPDCVDSSDDTDTDSDGIPDVTDEDDDNDGQTDEYELSCGSDPLDKASISTDTDSDTIPNCVDTDDDGDGVSDEEDAFPLDATENADTDNDGIGNNADTDDDGDGQSDKDELSCDSDPLDSASISTDTDSDNIPNCVDPDDDGDGVNDGEDAFPLDATEDTDTDGDGTGDNADPDNDGDGQSDEDELACGSDPLDASSMATDSDSDGTPDCKEESAYEYLALVGDATSAGWTPQGKLDTRMEMVSSGVWKWEGSLKGSGVFKIHTVEGDWCDGQWLVPVNDGDVMPTTAYAYDVTFGCEPNDYKWDVPADGFYSITVNTNTGTTISKELSYHPNLYIIGSATVSDWSADLAREMTQDPQNPAIFTWEGNLDLNYDAGFNDAEFKILSVRTFESGWEEIRATSANADPLNSNSFVVEEGGTGNDYKWQITDVKRGSYRITLNLETHSINFERLDYYPNLYVVGDATEKGWNPWSEDLEFTQDETSPELFSFRGNFIPGSFKIHTYVGDWNWGDYIVPTAADQNISATDYEINRQGQGNDYKWTISKEGMYTITLDQAANTINIILDTDGDGTTDSEDAFPEDPNEDTDTDNDGVGNNTDTDDDGDGQLDEDELACGSDPLDAASTATDTDGDHTPNCVDPDDSTDTDSDGIPNVTDPDDDNDGVPDAEDAFPLNENEDTDTDNDGIGNNADLDDDNDGVSDEEDAYPLDETETVDTDEDGIGDNADTDDDGDGQLDEHETVCGSDPLDAASTALDTDADSIPNCVDLDDDEDGVADDQDAFPLDPTEDTDTDNDGTGNNIDTDDDGDGQTDEHENACGSDPVDSASTSSDFDGDNIPDCVDMDDDGDGVEDSQDECPNTEAGAVVGLNGCSIFSLPADNFTVESTNTSCFGKANGKIRVSVAAPEYNYMVSIPDHDPVALPEGYSLDYTFTGLTPGLYPVCFTIEGQEDYEQCFEVKIDEPEAVMASTEVDYNLSTVIIDLEGPDKFYVSVNNKVQVLNAGTHKLELNNGMNEISIKGEQECQGEYFERIFVSADVRLYPNPTSGPVQMYIPGVDTSVDISVLSFHGAQVWTDKVPVNKSRVVEINLGNLETGTYILKITGDKTNETLKVIIK